MYTRPIYEYPKRRGLFYTRGGGDDYRGDSAGVDDGRPSCGRTRSVLILCRKVRSRSVSAHHILHAADEDVILLLLLSSIVRYTPQTHAFTHTNAPAYILSRCTMRTCRSVGITTGRQRSRSLGCVRRTRYPSSTTRIVQ